MKIVKALSLTDGKYYAYEVPSLDEALEYAEQTFDMVFDQDGEIIIEGSLPMVWKQVEG